MSLGEERVRLQFNPSGNPLVNEIKSRTAELINLCEDWKRTEPTPEGKRLMALAETAYEEASMWAVKAVTA
mgnify:CR=1 FL=1